jgi:Cu+-exporting ATPase
MSDHTHYHHGDPARDTEAATDPVCGMQVEMRQDARHREYSGETYWLCSETCELTFDADPHFYASVLDVTEN